MCRLLFESIRVQDGRPCLLEYHQARVNRSLDAGCAFDLAQAVRGMRLPEKGVFKLRVSYASDGGPGAVACDAYAPRVVRSLRLVECPALRYDRKFEDRRALLAARAVAADADEAVLTREGWVTDASYANLAFGRPGDWVTPSTFLLAGTKRAFLLDEGLLRECPVHVRDLPRYAFVTLINAMLDPGDVMVPFAALKGLELP